MSSQDGAAACWCIWAPDVCGLLIFYSPSSLRYDAHIHAGAGAYTQVHSAPKWVQLSERGERGAVMQRRGPQTGPHVHCLGIITSNSHAHWFWQAQGRTITGGCRQEWLCWTMTRQWLLLCTGDSCPTNNIQICTDDQRGSSCQTLLKQPTAKQWQRSPGFMHRWAFMMCSHFSPTVALIAFQSVDFIPWNYYQWNQYALALCGPSAVICMMYSDCSTLWHL